MSFTDAILACIGLTLGTFLAQLFGGHDWGAAAERSFFLSSGAMSMWLLWVIKS